MLFRGNDTNYYFSSTTQRFSCFWGCNYSSIDARVTVEMLAAFKRLVHALMSVDPKDRPTARQVLYGEEYKDLWIKEKGGRESILFAGEAPEIFRLRINATKQDTDVIMAELPKATPPTQQTAKSVKKTPADRRPSARSTENDGSASPAKKARQDSKKSVLRAPLADVSNSLLLK